MEPSACGEQLSRAVAPLVLPFHALLSSPVLPLPPKHAGVLMSIVASLCVYVCTQGTREVAVSSAGSPAGGAGDGSGAAADSDGAAVAPAPAPTPEAVGVELGSYLLAHGAEELLGGVKGARRPITYGQS